MSEIRFCASTKTRQRMIKRALPGIAVPLLLAVSVASAQNRPPPPIAPRGTRMELRQDNRLADLAPIVDLLAEDAEPAFTSGQVEAWINELVPLVEEVAGRPLSSRPELRLVSRSELAESLAVDVEIEVRWEQSYLTKDNITRIARMQAESLAPMHVAHYDLSDQVLYIAPRNVRPLLAISGVDEKFLESAMKIVLATELTRAIQNQHLDLTARLGELRNGHAREAFQTALEGHLSHVQDSLAERLSVDETIRESLRLLSRGLPDVQDVELRRLTGPFLVEFEFDHHAGREFIAHHARSGGSERVWSILAEPPQRITEILHFSRSGSPAGPSLDDRALLAGLENHFGDSEWMTGNRAVAEMELFRRWAALGAVRRISLLRSIVFFRTLRTNSLMGGRQGVVSLVRFKNAVGATAYLDALDDHLPLWGENLRNRASVESIEVGIEEFAGIECDDARCHVVHAQPAGREPVNVRTVRIARGDIVVEVSGVNFELSDEKTAEIAEEVFRRWDARAAAMPPES